MKELLETAKENLSFLLICVLIIVALAVVAHIAEHFLPLKRKVSPTRRVTILAMCSALAMVLHIFDFPLPFLAPDFFTSWIFPSFPSCCAPSTWDLPPALSAKRLRLC